MGVVERILKRFEEIAEDYGWSFDGSHLWEQQRWSSKSYTEAKYDIIYALLSAIKDETGRKFHFVIDPSLEDDDETEFVVFEGDRVISHHYFKPTVLKSDYYREIVEEIVKKLGITE